MTTEKMLKILEEVAEAVQVSIILGDYKKANEFRGILEAAKGLKKGQKVKKRR